MIDLFIMRHGQSEADILDVHEGRADFPLTDLGREQARRAAAWFAARYTVDRILSSTLQRAAETARIVGEALRVQVEYDAQLMEFNNGELAGLTREESRKRFGHLFAKRRELALHQSFPGGETPIQFRARAETVLSSLLEDTPDGAKLLLVSHGGMTNMLFRSFLRLPIDLLSGGVAISTGDTGIHHWQVDGAQRRIRFANSLAHLEGLPTA
jgi:2,3-bisphosphoglycerate-dependent phosphoglycerate mutase